MLHRKIIFEYNNPDKYNEDLHPQLEVAGDPAVFGPIILTQSQSTFKDCIQQYDIARNNWKLSGNHGFFGAINPSKPTLPFNNFIQNNRHLLYFHEQVQLLPDLLEKVTGALPLFAFSESISESTSTSTKKTPATKTNNNKNIEVLCAMKDDNASKNKTIELTVLNNCLNSLKVAIDEIKRNRESLIAARAR